MAETIEQKIVDLSQDVLELLLQDKATKKHIVWATDNYSKYGDGYAAQNEIFPELISGTNAHIIQPRATKTMAEQAERTKVHAEVMTPAWMICYMVNVCDEDWFGRPNVFNVLNDTYWAPIKGQIHFDSVAEWQAYVDSRRLEITCGEAPYIVSRYDSSTGERIPIERRIGILDRKLRVVTENTEDFDSWKEWAIRAIQSVYGFEYQGDNLTIARINILMTFMEYMQSRWNQLPDRKTLKSVANIIAWNFWQMNGYTETVPCETSDESPGQKMQQLSWLGMEEPWLIVQNDQCSPCYIRNWRGHSFLYKKLKERAGKNMRIDYVIGNPPYQDDRQGDSTTALPVYHKFMDAAYEISDVVELITPARFLFNAGRTPKKWNQKMLSDEHLKVILYESDGQKIFPNTDIKGGVAVTYRDRRKNYGEIGTFTIYPELNSILHKVMPFVKDKGALSQTIFVASKFNHTNLFIDYPQYIGHERRMSSNVLDFECFHGEMQQDDVAVYGIYNGKRDFRYIASKYVDLSDEQIGRYKVVLPKADGNGGFGETLTMPVVLPPNSGFTHTFMGVYACDTESVANNVIKYIKTKFARTMLQILKVTQDNNADKWIWVPIQEFGTNSDIDWTVTIRAIDQQLYKKYGLSEEEIQFIEKNVKEME